MFPPNHLRTLPRQISWKKTVLCLSVLAVSLSHAQSGIKPSHLIARHKIAHPDAFKDVDLFTSIVDENRKTRKSLDSSLSKYHIIDFNTAVKTQLFRTLNRCIEVEITISDTEAVVLELVDVEIHNPDFRIRTSSG